MTTDILRLIPKKLPASISGFDTALEFKQWLAHGFKENPSMCYFMTEPAPTRLEQIEGKLDKRNYASVMAFMNWAPNRILKLKEAIDGDKPSKSKPAALEEIFRLEKQIDLINAVKAALKAGVITVTQMKQVKLYSWSPDVYQYIVHKTTKR